MDSEVSATELAIAEARLRSTAERALKVETTRAARDVIKQLVGIAVEVIPVVSDFEGIDDPYELARNALTFPANQNPKRVEYALNHVDYLEELATSQTDA